MRGIMNLDGILPFARKLLEKVIGQGDVCVDGTAGNGHDTLFLAKRVGKNGRVYSFDIQKQALDNTRERLLAENELDQVILIHDGHEKAKQYIDKNDYGKIKGAVFNLGYLPGGDKSIVTKPETTICAVEQLFEGLECGGIIVLVIYHGHEEGKIERNEILNYVSKFSQEKAYVLKYEFINQINNPPFIIAIEKRC